MLNCVKVDVPKEHVVTVTWGKNKIKYVYYILRSYRNEKNQPTCDRISIGKLDEESGYLIPNDNFFDIFDCEVSVKVNGLKEKVKDSND